MTAKNKIKRKKEKKNERERKINKIKPSPLFTTLIH